MKTTANDVVSMQQREIGQHTTVFSIPAFGVLIVVVSDYLRKPIKQTGMNMHLHANQLLPNQRSLNRNTLIMCSRFMMQV